MGVYRESGYSASVHAFFITKEFKFALAKTNGRTFVLAEPIEFPPGTSGDIVVFLDGEKNSQRRVSIPCGVAKGETIVTYVVEAPF